MRPSSRVQQTGPPTRGSIVHSAPSTVAVHGVRWIGVNVALFLLPTLISFLFINVFGIRPYLTAASTFDLVYTAIYFLVTSGCLALTYGWLFSPSFFRYHLLGSLWTPPRKRRWSWTFMSQRRQRQWKELMQARPQTLFVTAFSRHTMALTVTPEMTIEDVHSLLRHRGALPDWTPAQRPYFFATVGLRRSPISWGDTIDSLGLDALSSLQLRIRLPGGSSKAAASSAVGGNHAASGSGATRTSTRTRDNRPFEALLLAEGLDEDGNPSVAAPVAPRRKRKRKLTQVRDDENSDPSDNDFSGSDGGDGSASESDSDSDEEARMSNGEIADSLPAMTDVSSRQRTAAAKGKAKGKGKAKEKAPPKTRRKRARKAAVQSEDDDLDPRPTTSTSAGEHPYAQKKQKRGGRRNPIYFFFEDVDKDADGNKEVGATYHRCWLGKRKILKITPAMNYSLNGLKGHLLRLFPAHNRLYEVLCNQKRAPTPEELDIIQGKTVIAEGWANAYIAELDGVNNNIREMLEKQAAAAQVPWDQTHFEELVAKWVAACDMPFTAVDEPEFRAMLTYTHHPAKTALKIPHAGTIRSRIMDMGVQMFHDLKDIFRENTSNFSISLDAWTSGNGHAFIAIVAHWIGNNGKLEECLVDFVELHGEHSGENMASAVWSSLDQLGISGRIISFVMDNATNNDTLIEHFAAKCHARNIPFSEENGRMRCLPHVIHLAALELLKKVGALSDDDVVKAMAITGTYQDAATDALDRSRDDDLAEEPDAEDTEAAECPDGTVGVGQAIFKLRKIVRHVRSSPQRRRHWEDVVRRLNPDPTTAALMLILDVKTRWSSTHQMLRRALTYKDSIDMYVRKDSSLRKYAMDDDDWKAIELVASWLKLFRHATVQMSTTKSPMLSTTHAVFRGLQAQLKDIITALPYDVDDDLRDGLVNAHWKLSEYFLKFDQSQYTLWACLLDPRIAYESLYRDYKSDPDLHARLEKSKIALKAHFLANYAPAHGPATSTPPDETLKNASPVKIDFTSRYAHAAPSGFDAEVDEYFRITSRAEPWKIDPLQWWFARREQFPHLYRFARDVLCIPGSAVAVERIFSGGRDTIGLRRASLKADTIQTLMFVKARLRMSRAAIIEILGDED